MVKLNMMDFIMLKLWAVEPARAYRKGARLKQTDRQNLFNGKNYG